MFFIPAFNNLEYDTPLSGQEVEDVIKAMLAHRKMPEGVPILFVYNKKDLGTTPFGNTKDEIIANLHLPELLGDREWSFMEASIYDEGNPVFDEIVKILEPANPKRRKVEK